MALLKYDGIWAQLKEPGTAQSNMASFLDPATSKIRTFEIFYNIFFGVAVLEGMLRDLCPPRATSSPFEGM